ncbi:hypothetical protein H311_01984 [Anncaliia algerae PRA109]|uniref:Uncharacterized protein n=1 Tax=Anncaliia algerae PRA339 TaxID=1288291 RepID=A0A059EVU6_9MICR|nr:hypothetical protein H311_02243 [Anncaliia algerae PRA109]KCZ77011.1 hypothetical protein H311_01984 [Anncaliia algerae PRA109]KCZ79128.1 hypothetical protein H312_03490 [Anncaliia algerae PRA339]
MLNKEENTIHAFANNLKNDVKLIQNKLETHNLLIESIEAASAKNVELLNEGTNKFNKTVDKMKKDPRNYIIILLFFTVITLLYYLSS